MRNEEGRLPGRPSENAAAAKLVGSAVESTGRPAGFQPMPSLSVDEYAALRDDIAARGILVPVVADQHGRLIDGHHRRQAALELGVHCPTEIRHVQSDDEALDLAVTLNATRRHLSREQRRELIRAEIERRPEDSDRAIARRVGCSPSTVGAVRGHVSKLDTTTTDMSRGEAEELTQKIDHFLDDINTLLLQALSNGVDPMHIVGLLTAMQRHMERAPEATPDAVAWLRRVNEKRIEWVLDFAEADR